MTLASREVARSQPTGEVPPTVLVIDGDCAGRRGLAATLSVEGFDVMTADGGEEGLDLLASTPAPSLVLLGARLGDPVGFSVFRQIVAAVPEVPVVTVTATDDELDAVLALEAGAADHLTRPVRSRELGARLRAVLRRTGARPGPPAGAPDGIYSLGPVTLDVARREATVDGRNVKLSGKEFGLLALLVSETGHVVSRRQCLDRIWRDRPTGDSRTVDTHVKRLRRKIEAEPSAPRHILTVRGIGYRFTP